MTYNNVCCDLTRLIVEAKAVVVLGRIVPGLGRITISIRRGRHGEEEPCNSGRRLRGMAALNKLVTIIYPRWSQKEVSLSVKKTKNVKLKNGYFHT